MDEAFYSDRRSFTFTMLGHGDFTMISNGGTTQQDINNHEDS